MLVLHIPGWSSRQELDQPLLHVTLPASDVACRLGPDVSKRCLLLALCKPLEHNRTLDSLKSE
jgi:hypothetical protein